MLLVVLLCSLKSSNVHVIIREEDAKLWKRGVNPSCADFSCFWVSKKKKQKSLDACHP